jgi:CDP-4-dehydro-6-deoxyglucose reductase
MAYQATLSPSGHQFAVNENEPLLDAALRQGVKLPHGCRDGACGACKGKVVAGDIDHGAAQLHALSAAERAVGWALFCCATVKSDVHLSCKEVAALEGIPVKTLPARVLALEFPAPDVAVLTLKLPTTETFRFLAGQYIDILLKDGQRRSFSLANPPHLTADGLVLHIRQVPGGQFTSRVFNELQPRDILRFSGPHGSFFLREGSARPLLLVAGGTGFAPIRAIVEHSLALEMRLPIALYWGARRQRDLYQGSVAAAWAEKYPHITYVPVLSEPELADAWRGRSGFVHRAVLEDFADLSAYDVYVCGAPAMVDAARADFVGQAGLPAERFFADAFNYAGH